MSVKEPTVPQSEKFKELAREVGADESESAFEDRLRQVAKPKPKQEKTPDE